MSFKNEIMFYNEKLSKEYLSSNIPKKIKDLSFDYLFIVNKS